MSRVEITLKSGAVIKVKCSDWQIEKRENRVCKLTLNEPSPRIPYICLDEIAAIVAID